MTSPPTSTTTYKSEPNRQVSSQRPIWLVSLMFLGSLVAFALIVGRREVSRWHMASALNAVEEARYDDAIKTANNGLKWDPDYAELIGLRAVAHMQQQDFESCLVDYDQLLEIAAIDETVTESDIAPLSAKANVLQRMNRFDDSIAQWDDVVEFREEQYRLRDDNESQYAYAIALNNRAYVEAQAKTRGNTNVDIQKSLADIKLAMKIRVTQDDPVMVDTLGYLLLLNGDNEAALEELEGAVQRTRIENEAIKRRYRIETQKAEDGGQFEQVSKQLDQQYSVILHHRGEAYAALGESEKAEADIEEAKRLGYNQDEGIW